MVSSYCYLCNLCNLCNLRIRLLLYGVNARKYSISVQSVLFSRDCSQANLRRQSLTRDRFHHIAETIELTQRRVNVWCNSQALEFFVNNRRGEDAMLVE